MLSNFVNFIEKADDTETVTVQRVSSATDVESSDMETKAHEPELVTSVHSGVFVSAPENPSTNRDESQKTPQRQEPQHSSADFSVVDENFSRNIHKVDAQQDQPSTDDKSYRRSGNTSDDTSEFAVGHAKDKHDSAANVTTSSYNAVQCPTTSTFDQSLGQSGLRSWKSNFYSSHSP